MAIEWTQITILLNSDFTLRLLCDESLTGKTVEFVMRKEAEDAAIAYSVTTGITFATVNLADDAADIPFAATGTNALEEGIYQGAIWRADSGQQRPFAYGPMLAKRAASPP